MRFLGWLTSAAVAFASTVLHVGSTTYYSPDFLVGTVSFERASAPTVAVPAAYLSRPPVSYQDFKTQMHELLSSDDVISTIFFSTVILPSGVRLPSEVEQCFESKDISIFNSSLNNTMASGPYFLHPSGRLSRVYRLYTDTSMAFTQGVIEGEGGRYFPSVAAAGDGANAAISIPVPSRHYYPKPSAEKPLSGLRLAIKDVFNLGGIKTGGGSRAYAALYPPAAETASSLQRLIDMGAVVVGKVKTSQFAIGEVPTANYVDQLAPFNPRGDGYQSPSASSCGPGAAIASYDWLDLALGTDTTGSIRGPSAANGVFGMRITNASLPLDGILPISAAMDTPGLLARDAELLQKTYSRWLNANASYSSFPKTIILPDESWSLLNATATAAYDEFFRQLSALTGAKIEHLSVNKSFIENTGNKEGLDTFVGAFQAILVLDQWENLGKPFFSDYQKQFGRSPFVDPVLRMGLSIAQNISSADYNEAQRRLKIYRAWFTSQLVPSCESSLVAYPLNPGSVLYRDDSLRSAHDFVESSVYSTQQAAFAGVPDYAVPIGVREYTSAVSGVKEQLPVSVGLIAGAGCDNMLLDMIVGLGRKNEGFKTVVKTGRVPW
ncbi:hypothetical protein V2A60_002564 [Cordyceps javanica]|uniref:Amidase signature enzyme n=1 Tax=Cordyceps javanica TaxID=43265 RepID=A0A545UY48_9HYPO|nr:amidase signature enzyme [Cordyceps javanica]TQW06273.1 amidase signature enzyme [Cordyceps javanica]